MSDLSLAHSQVLRCEDPFEWSSSVVEQHATVLYDKKRGGKINANTVFWEVQ